MSVTINGPATLGDGSLGEITVVGDADTVYTIDVFPGLYSGLFYNGSEVQSVPLALTGTPSQLDADLAATTLVNIDRPTVVQGAYIEDTSGNLLYSGANCYLSGTLILTSDGERRIDDLREGDEILTHDDGYVPVQWIGHQRFTTSFSTPAEWLPVRIAAGALGDGTPETELFVSPDHSLLIDGVFVHARLLLGCPGIAQVRGHGVIAYLHVDLGAHHAILANGAWSESYAEQFNRSAFANAATWRGDPRFIPLCRRQALAGGPALAEIRARLAGSAALAA